MQKAFTLLLIILTISACSVKPKGEFSADSTPLPPDYAMPSAWAALPTFEDKADLTPGDTFQDNQANADVDVFYLHPTTYTGTKGQNQWNGSLQDEALNEKTELGAVQNQASIFNGVGKIYAPRYRQAHLHVYFEKKRKASARAAFDMAYEDVKAAFEYYLDNYNHGRPIVIAAHSQGTSHAMRLLKEFFEDKLLMNQLVVAYIPGILIEGDYFKKIKPCSTPEELGCFCTWRTFKAEHIPKKFYEYPNDYVSVNPVSWTLEDSVAPKSAHEGAVLLDFEEGIVPNLIETQNHQGILWVSKPKFPGSIFFTTKNYHIADFNFFYADIRKNVALRVGQYLEKK